jgi:hypothetical protein
MAEIPRELGRRMVDPWAIDLGAPLDPDFERLTEAIEAPDGPAWHPPLAVPDEARDARAEIATPYAADEDARAMAGRLDDAAGRELRRRETLGIWADGGQRTVGEEEARRSREYVERSLAALTANPLGAIGYGVGRELSDDPTWQLRYAEIYANVGNGLSAPAMGPDLELPDLAPPDLAPGADGLQRTPEEILRERGHDEAIDVLENATRYDAQEHASEPSAAAGRAGRVPLTAEQKRTVVLAQAELSKEMQVGMGVRKAIDFVRAGQLLSGTDGYTPSLYGDFSFRGTTEGMTAKQAVATLGLDYEGSRFVEPGGDGKMTFARDVDELGVFMIDSVMTKDMLGKARVPLGHDVMLEAKRQAHELAEPGEAAPPMLQLDDDGNLRHAYERNRQRDADPRTGLGNSTVHHGELIAEAGSREATPVNQELTMRKPELLPTGPGDSELNLVRPDGSLVHVADLVIENDDQGRARTRWKLSDRMPALIRQRVLGEVDRADRAARAAWRRDKQLAEKEGRPAPPPPPLNPELEEWRQDRGGSHAAHAS